MGKFGNIDLGRFDKLWSATDARYLQNFIDNSAMLTNNYTFWRENFSVASGIIEPDENGVMSFTVTNKIIEPDGMAEFKGSSLAKNTGIDFKGSNVYSGSLPVMGKALNPRTVLDREKDAKIIAQFGSDSRLVKDYIESIQTLKNYVDSRISNMAGQIMSTGAIVGKNDSTSGIQLYGFDAQIPTANKVTAGTKVWTATDCDILDQMYTIEEDYRQRTGDLSPHKWQIPLYMWRNSFLKNAKLKASAKDWLVANDRPVASGGTIAESTIISYINGVGLTSPIEIVLEGEVEKGIAYQKNVQGWANNVAVFRPTGFAGQVLKGEILKAKLSASYKSNSMERTVAYLDSGVMALINSIDHSEEFPKWLTDIECCAAPVLTEAPYHVIVDTTTADS